MIFRPFSLKIALFCAFVSAPGFALTNEENSESASNQAFTNYLGVATNQAKKKSKRFDTLVVTGSRTEEDEKSATVRTRIVTGEELRKGGFTSIREALDRLPGLQSYGHGGNSYVQMQGLNNGYVKILVDGIPLSGIIGDGLPLENLPISSIEKIELVNGASSSLYGSDAVAGVIQIFTRKTDQNPTRLTLFTDHRYLTSGLYLGELSVGQSFRPFSWTLKASYRDEDGVRTPTNVGSFKTEFISQTQKRLLNLSAFASFRAGSAMFRLQGSTSASEQVLSTDVPFLTKGIQGRLEGSAAYSQKFSENFSQLLNLSLRYFAESNATSNSLSRYELFDLDQSFLDFQGEYTAELKSSDKRIGGMFGFNFLEESFRFVDIKNGFQNRETYEIFGQGRFELLPENRLALTVGARLSYSPVFGAKAVPQTALRFSPWEFLQLRISYGQGYKVPSLKQNYFNWVHPPPTNFLITGNDTLRPESSHSFQSGIVVSPDPALRLELSGFYHLLTDQIDFGAAIPGTGFRNGKFYAGMMPYTNLNKSYSRGFEAGVNGTVKEWFRYGLHYEFLQSRVTEATNADIEKDLTLRSPHSVKLSLGGKIPVIQTGWSIQSAWRDRMILDDVTKALSAPYFVIDLQLRQTFLEYYSIYIGVNNLLDNREKDWDLQDGRTFYIGARIEWFDITRIFDRVKKP